MNNQIKKNGFTHFRPRLLSKHATHDILRPENKNLPLIKFKSVIRFGSTTEVDDSVAKGGDRIEINTVEAVKNSMDKLNMKNEFTKAGVKTADWFILDGKQFEQVTSKNGKLNYTNTSIDKLPYPIVSKHRLGSRGTGNRLHKTAAELTSWLKGKDTSNYVFERFYSYGMEFRLHVTEAGYFYTCRKALKKNAPKDRRWRRHDDDTVWFVEANPSFKKPNSWNDIVKECVKALKAVGGDVLSFDVKVQKPTDKKGKARKFQEFFILECNSASGMDNIKGKVSQCAQAYINELPKLLERKYSAWKKGKLAN